MSKCLVTGGTGLLGNGMKEALRKRMGGLDMAFVWLSSKDCNLLDLDAVLALFDREKPSHCVHLAARVGGVFANKNDQIGFLRENTSMNDNVVQACHAHKIQRAVFCLSTCVFPAEISLPFDETSLHSGPPHWSNEGYATSKRILEQMCRFHRAKYGYDWVCVAPTNLYGPHDNFNLENSHLVPGIMHRMMLAKQKGDDMVIWGSGKPFRQFLHSEDAGFAIVKLLVMPTVPHHFLILACETEEHRISDVGQMIKVAMDFEGDLTQDASKEDGIFKKTAKADRLLDVIGKDFQFISLSNGLRSTYKWFEANWPDNIRK